MNGLTRVPAPWFTDPDAAFAAEGRGLRRALTDLVDDVIVRLSVARERAEHERRARMLDPARASQELTAVVLTVEPSRFLEQCLIGLERQTLRPVHIEIVRNVSPFSKASQEGLDRVRTPFYASVDEDMILAADCLERLYLAATADDKIAEVAMRLRDPILGKIFGVHLYRTEAAREIGFHPLKDEKGSERRMTAELRARGWQVRSLQTVGGVHHPDYSPEEIYWKFRFAGEKARFYGGAQGESERRQALSRLRRFWRETRSDLVYFALAGFEEGLNSAQASAELDYRRRNDAPALKAVREWLAKRDKHAKQP